MKTTILSTRALAIAIALGLSSVSPLTHAGLFSKKPQIVAISDAGQAGVFKVVEKGASLGGARKIMLASFTVEFATEHSLQISKKGFGSSNTVSSTYYQVPDVQALQDATDKAYAAFVERATADGYEIVSQDEMLANPSFKAVQEAAQPQAYKRDAAGIHTISFAAGKQPIVGAGSYFLFSELAGNHGDIAVLSHISMAKEMGGAMSQGQAFIASSNALKALASESAMPVVSLHLTAGFADLTMSGESKSSGNMTVGTNSKFGLHFSKFNTNMMLHMPGEKPRVVYNEKALSQPAQIIADIQDESPTKRNVTLGLVNLALGGKSGNKAVKYKVTLDADVLQASLAQSSSTIGAALLQAIAK